MVGLINQRRHDLDMEYSGKCECRVGYKLEIPDESSNWYFFADDPEYKHSSALSIDEIVIDEFTIKCSKCGERVTLQRTNT
jgi:hypothetical protein